MKVYCEHGHYISKFHDKQSTGRLLFEYLKFSNRLCFSLYKIFSHVRVRNKGTYVCVHVRARAPARNRYIYKLYIINYI